MSVELFVSTSITTAAALDTSRPIGVAAVPRVAVKSRTRQDEALRYALSAGVLDAFTIGAESKAEQEDLVRRIAAA